MKLIKIKLFIVAMLIFLHGNQCDAEGFLAGTIVKTPNGYTKIEDLHIGDYVICYDKQKNYVESKIVCTDKKSIERYVRIAIAAEYLCLACDQKLYKKEDDV